jgi:hypothetical protein
VTPFDWRATTQIKMPADLRGACADSGTPIAPFVQYTALMLPNH